MKILYRIIIYIYYFSVIITSIFNKKARLWLSGREGLFNILQRKVDILDRSNKRIWIHCASLGEFEQGRPVIEKIKQQYSDYIIILTFFSPSGYEVRKDYKYVDIVSYLPLDTSNNSKKFINIVKPDIVIFVKYEFWYNIISQIYKRNIPLFLISAKFRQDQLFFKKYGKHYRNILSMFTHIFVQDNNSAKLLNSFNIDNVTVSGDTRIDRVFTISNENKEIDIIRKWKNNNKVFICGSVWDRDIKIISQLVNSIDNPLIEYKYIIAPHEINNSQIINIKKSFRNKKTATFSEIQNDNNINADIIIIDCIGILNVLYKYADISYVGGGFNNGIHNTLEPAVYGLPIIFGPKYHKFNEAIELINNGAGFSVKNYSQLKEKLIFLSNDNNRNISAIKAKEYVISNIGATNIIINKIFFSSNLDQIP